MASLSSASPSHTFFVRNTFLCVVDPAEEDILATAGPVARRSRSEPELLRLSSPLDIGAKGAALAEADVPSEPALPRCSSPSSAPSTAPTASTLPGHMEQDPSEADMEEGQLVRRTSSSLAALALADPSSHIPCLLRSLAEGGRPVALEVAAALGTEGAATLARIPAAAPIFEELFLSLATGELGFIAEAIAHEARALALQPQGHAAICGLLAFGQGQPFAIRLADEVLKSDAASLCSHKFGHQVAISLASTGLARHKRAIVQSLCQDLQRFARHRYASKVAVQIVMSSSWQESQPLLDALLAPPAGAARAACHIFGVELVSAFLTQQVFHAQVAESCSLGVHKMVKDKYGRTIVKQLGLSAQVPVTPEQTLAEAPTASANQRGPAVYLAPTAQALPYAAKPLPIAPFFLQPMVLAPHFGVMGGA